MRQEVRSSSQGYGPTDPALFGQAWFAGASAHDIQP
jgi:hypothetical protein